MFMTVFHEFGHFISAKIFRIKVLEFAVGMGPAIFKKQGKETLYSLRLLPIGGYCKMEGEEEFSDDERSFSKAKVWKRFIVVVSGAAMNLLLGFIAIIVSVCCFYNLIPTTTVARFDTLKIEEKEVEPVSNGEGGLMVGDEIIAVDGERVSVTSDIDYILGLSQETAVSVTVKRDGEVIVLDSVPFHQLEYNGTKGLISDFTVYGVKKDFFSVFDFSFKETVGAVRMVFRTLKSLVTGKVPVTNISSIIGIGGAISESVSKADSFRTVIRMLLYYLYIISINLGVMNLLPFPALDGGHVVFLAYEAIFRKPVPQKLYTILNVVGFALLFALLIAVMIKDIIQLII